MITVSYLNKGEKEQWLPELFDILYANMRLIAPGGGMYEEEKTQWMANVSPALEKAPRQILLCFAGDTLAGYLQYYTRENFVMVEELQIKAAYQRTAVFRHLGRFLTEVLPADIVFIEAYADRRNGYSRRLMGKLGMVELPDGENTPFVHLRGPADKARKLFK